MAVHHENAGLPASQPEERLAATASAIADKSRARMLCALMDGRAWTATELSVTADISASTASAHLSRLTEQGFITCLSQGRHRYYRLAGVDIAELLEKLMGVSWASPIRPRNSTPVHLRRARTCYDHLAGEIAVALYERMLTAGWLAHDGTELTAQGREKLATLGVDCTRADTRRRKFCCACLDWSERRHHLGGALGASLLAHFEQKRWLVRSLDSRGVTFTASGARALKRFFGISV